MPRPALIVGLGGTGQWVLTWLKRDLMLSNNGVMPQNVRLLELDTCRLLEAGASRITASGKKEEAAEVGDVMLGPEEFVYVGGNAQPLAQQIKEKQNKGKDQVTPWFPAGQWLSTQGPRTFQLDQGAGRLRQFGRLAMFMDLKGEEAGSKIWTALRSAIEGVRSSVDEERSLEIIVVGSFAGGTGSGLFIDTALILRLLAGEKQLDVPHILRGVFALPGVFTTAPDAEMKARSFAAWRELNRFMVVDPDFQMPEIRYVSINPEFRIQPTQRLFDACYLVDGKRDGQPIAQEPRYGVFPMLAEALSAILDEKAGTAYTQWIFTNLAPEYAKRPETPMYSAVGAYTVQVPAYFIQERASYEFGKKTLLNLLSPKREPDEEGRMTASGAERHLALAAPDQNQEDRGFAGRKRSLTLLNSSSTYENRSAKPTLFHNRIADIVEDAVDQNKHQSLVDLLARGGSGPASWVTYFPDLGDDQQFESTRRTVAEQMEYNLVQQYRRREGESAEAARARFRQISDDLRKRFGGISASGEEIEEFHGTCGDALQECERVQLIIFRNLVQLRLLDILNGHTDDPLIAKSGKLGYAWDYFDGMVSELDRFLRLMSDVKKRREEVKPEIQLAGMAKKAQDFLYATSGKKIFWIWEHPKVKGAELEYLNAQQRLMEIRREDILHFYVVETAREMKAICGQVRDTLQRWIWHLSTGDSASQLPGLWDELRYGEQKIRNAHSYDTSSSTVKQLIADESLSVSEEDIKQALEQWEWVTSFNDGELGLQARILPQATEETLHKLVDPTSGESPERRNEIGEENQKALLALVRRRFSGVAARTTVAEEIQREHPDPEIFAKDIANISAEPLFDGTGKGCVKKSNLIRVLADENDPYFIGEDGLEGHLRGIHHLDRTKRDDTYGIQVVGSENPYKLTFVRTDDLYAYDTYTAWGLCLASYQAHVAQEGGELDPVLLHNFTAEAEAVKIEQQLVRGGIEYRSLHPRVVMLLEDRMALEQFVNLYVMNMISKSPTSSSSYRWELTWSRGNQSQTIWLTKGWNEQAKSSRPDIFNAIHGYVIMKQTQQPGFNHKVDTEFARILIEQHREEMGRHAERELLKYHIGDRKGLVQRLKRKGYEYLGDKVVQVLRQEYVDLATVIELILNKRLRKLDAAQRREEEEQERQAELKRRKRKIQQQASAAQEQEAEAERQMAEEQKQKATAKEFGVSHPRVVRLLGDGGQALQQFVYLGILKMIKGTGPEAAFRWQLTWPTEKGDQTFWLTPAWNAAIDDGPRPDILEAMYGYVVIGETQQPQRSDTIDHEYAQQLIDSKLNEKGSTEQIAMLERNLEPTGFVGWLRKLGSPDTPEYAELADMVEKMLRKKIEEIEISEQTLEIDPWA